MVSYKLSPYIHFIESHLRSDAVQYGVFHLLTGKVFEPSQRVRALLFAAKLGQKISFSNEDLDHLGPDGKEIRALTEDEFLVGDTYDALHNFAAHYIVRPLQNPAVTYQSETGETLLVRLSMAEKVYSPKRDALPAIIEEKMPPAADDLFLAADGTKTLRNIFVEHNRGDKKILEDYDFRAAIEFLTEPERQLIKFTKDTNDLDHPFQPFNTVPRNFFHSSRWKQHGEANNSISDFHIGGIEDATWQFDVIEPTVNHALRFPSDILGGLDYGSRFCDSTLKPGVLPLLAYNERIEVLEIGGGTGSFALSFIERANVRDVSIRYNIMDLSPALVESQRRILGGVKPSVTHIAQDATEFDMPGCTFDLIIANEVIADFPVASVERLPNDQSVRMFAGDGAGYLEKYGLSIKDAPNRFHVNAGVFSFLERAWKHLAPGGALIISEYGSESRYPAESFHLNHSEFSIHFGHVAECARRIGFEGRLESLREFLCIDDSMRVLNGREEHIRCLNYVFKKFGESLPFALFSEREFQSKFGELAARIELNPVRFLPLRSNFHYGPNIDDFLVLIMNKPVS
jgi:protein-L-isoaspartate O-methyltransferase